MEGWNVANIKQMIEAINQLYHYNLQKFDCFDGNDVVMILLYLPDLSCKRIEQAEESVCVVRRPRDFFWFKAPLN